MDKDYRSTGETDLQVPSVVKIYSIGEDTARTVIFENRWRADQYARMLKEAHYERAVPLTTFIDVENLYV